MKLKIQQALHLLPALRLVWQSSPMWTVVRGILLVVQSGLPLLTLYLTKLIVDTVAAGLITREQELSLDRMALLIGLIGATTLLLMLCGVLSELVNTAHSFKITDHVMNLLHLRAIEVDLEHYENPRYHDIMQRAQQEAAYRPTQMLNRVTQVAQDGISLLAMVGLLLSLHWGIAGLLFIAAIPGVLVRVKYAGVLYRWKRQRTPLERQIEYLNWLLTLDLFAKEVRLFNLGTLFRAEFCRLREQIYQESFAIARSRSIANLAAQLLAGLVMFAAYAFIVYQTLEGILRLGDLVLYHQAFQRAQNALKGLLAGLSGLYEDNLFLTNFYEFLTLQPRVIQPSHPKPFPRPMRAGIVFDGVSFQYSNTTRQALKNINLSIHPGEVIALVGENGSGKTTLVKLLCRLYDPTGGKITVDGIDLCQFDIAALRREISVIFQDYAKYHFTAQMNIWLGNVDLPPTQDSIAEAAYRSGADEVIQSLPRGYETVLGKLFDQGEELSIGQWQKIALARAFLRNSQVIVLDEPTSAMDPKAEYEVFQKFRLLIKDQMAVLISHRLSTVKMADRIYVMANGSIVESGTHDQLMQLGGTYAYLFETQAKNYR